MVLTLSNGGASRSRTEVHGFAIRCIATLPTRRRNSNRFAFLLRSSWVRDAFYGFELMSQHYFLFFESFV